MEKQDKDRRATTRHRRKQDREVTEARALNAAVKAPTYYCPVPRGPSGTGGEVAVGTHGHGGGPSGLGATTLRSTWLQPEKYTREAAWELQQTRGTSG